MPAPRFSMVLVVITLFGMWFSSLVGSAERPLEAYRSSHACLLADSPACEAQRFLRSFH